MPDTPQELWRSQAAFDILCDIIASDSLVCITGAGVSFGLRRRDGSGSLPGWKALLADLFAKFASRITGQERQDCQAILAEPSPPGTRLIELASIIRKNNEPEFDVAFKDLVTPETGKCTDKHSALLEIQPRGIVTFNYDNGHENAAAALGQKLDVLLPTDEGKIAHTLNRRISEIFLLKAHGSIDDPQMPLVLTYESYRDLLVKSPAYRAFVQNILTNFHLLIVGFGLSDPDFDVFIHNLVGQYGSILRQHVVLRGVGEQSNQEIELRRRYGIHTLYLESYDDIPRILRDAASSASRSLRELLRLSVYSESGHERGEAHQKLRHLGPAGRKSAVEELKKAKDKLTATPSLTEPERLKRAHYLSEIAYTLGTIDAKQIKPILMAIVDEDDGSIAPAARALTVLRGVLELVDLPTLHKWLARFKTKYLDNTDGHRLVVYTEYLIVYVSAKYNSDLKKD